MWKRIKTSSFQSYFAIQRRPSTWVMTTCRVNLYGRWRIASITTSTTNSTKFLHNIMSYILFCNDIVTPSTTIELISNHLSVEELFSTLSTSIRSKTYIKTDFTWYKSWFVGGMWLGNIIPHTIFIWHESVGICKILYYGLQRSAWP